MRRVLLALACALAAAGCGSEPTPEEREAKAARDIAMVKKAARAAPPLRQVTLEAIRYDDIEAHAMFGRSCNYAPGTGLGTRVIAREGDAFIKMNGKVRRLAADPGSPALPAMSRTLYAGREYSLRLQTGGEGRAGPDGGTMDYEGTISLRDAWGREVYRGSGLARCAA